MSFLVTLAALVYLRQVLDDNFRLFTLIWAAKGLEITPLRNRKAKKRQRKRKADAKEPPAKYSSHNKEEVIKEQKREQSEMKKETKRRGKEIDGQKLEKFE